jgi:hypothetical protein
MKSFILFVFICILFHLPTFSQCYILDDLNPAFEVTVPNGVTIDSAFLIITNFERNNNYTRGRGRSFSELLSAAFIEEDEIFPITNMPLSGPRNEDYQIESGLDEFYSFPGHFVKMDWKVFFYCSGLQGSNLDYSGVLNGNLANPDNLGSIYDGVNVISGNIDLTVEGPGYLAYYDYDYDGFGSDYDSLYVCDDYFSEYSLNKLDCDDFDANIYPGAQEICDGIDNNCDGILDDFVQNTFIGSSGSSWGDQSNWSLNRLPLACDDINIPEGINLISPSNTIIQGASMTIKTNSIVTVPASSQLQLRKN